MYTIPNNDGRTQRRFLPGGHGSYKDPKANESIWCSPYRWDAAAAMMGERCRVQCVLSGWDILDSDERAPDRARLIKIIEGTPNVDWLVFTGRLGGAVYDPWCERWPPNVWLGIPFFGQASLNRQLQPLGDLEARVKFAVYRGRKDKPLDVRKLADTVDWISVPTDLRTNRITHPLIANAIAEQCADRFAIATGYDPILEDAMGIQSYPNRLPITGLGCGTGGA